MKTYKFLIKTSFFGVLAIVLVIFALMLAYSQMIGNVLTDEMENVLKANCAQDANIVKLKVDDDLGTMRDVASTIGVFYQKTPQDLIPLLQKLAAANDFKRMGMVFTNGDAFVSDDENARLASNSELTNREWFKAGIIGSQFVSGVLQDRITAGKIVVYATPVFSQNEIIGVLFAAIDISKYQNILHVEAFNGRGISHVVTKDGNLVAPSRSESAHKITESIYELADSQNKQHIVNFDKIIADMRSGKEGFLQFVALGQDRYIYYSPVGINDWWVLSTVPVSVVAEKTQSIIFFTDVLLVVVSILFTALLIYNFCVYKSNKEELDKIAYYDELTGKPNIAHFKFEFDRILKAYPERRFAVVKLDIVKFKSINEIMGFETGDKLIKAITKTLADFAKRDDCSFARVTADEFIFLDSLGDMTLEEHNKRIDEFKNAFVENANFIENNKIEFRFGRYLLAEGENNFKDIFEKVNLAHRIAKAQVSDNVCDYSDEFRKKFLREVELANKFESSLGNDEFKLFVQPKYRIADEKIVGGESLVRWMSNDVHVSFPNEFISVFEKNGAVLRLDFEVLKKTCQMLVDTIAEGIKPVCVSVNFSRLHIMNSNGKFLENLCATVDKYALPHGLIELEITETAVMDNEKELLEFLREIHASGFSLAMDDFGTGFSSLGLLKNMPFDSLKLDRSFFVDAQDNKRSYSVVESISEMTKKLSMKTVAEGVEFKEQIDMLKGLGYEVVQGYYYAKPMSADQFVALLRKQGH